MTCLFYNPDPINRIITFIFATETGGRNRKCKYEASSLQCLLIASASASAKASINCFLSSAQNPNLLLRLKFFTRNTKARPSFEYGRSLNRALLGARIFVSFQFNRTGLISVDFIILYLSHRTEFCETGIVLP